MATRLSNQVEPQPSPNVPFSAPDKTSDIVFIVEDQEIHFTKAFLIACSPVFERMFESDFAERNASDIPLPDKKHRDIVEFFKQIHPAVASISTVTDDNLLALLDLSREYGMEAVYKKCESYICKEADIHRETIPQRKFLSRINTPAKAVTQTKLVGKQDLDSLRVMLFVYACEEHDFQDYLGVLKDIASTKKTKEIERSQYYSLLQADTLLDIYRSRSKLLE